MCCSGLCSSILRCSSCLCGSWGQYWIVLTCIHLGHPRYACPSRSRLIFTIMVIRLCCIRESSGTCARSSMSSNAVWTHWTILFFRPGLFMTVLKLSKSLTPSLSSLLQLRFLDFFEGIHDRSVQRLRSTGEKKPSIQKRDTSCQLLSMLWQEALLMYFGAQSIRQAQHCRSMPGGFMCINQLKQGVNGPFRRALKENRC